MEIIFINKEESNKTQEEAFLALSPLERIYSFLHLHTEVKKVIWSYSGKKG